MAVLHRDDAQIAGIDPECRQKCGNCRANGAERAVLDLRHDRQAVRRTRRRRNPLHHPSRPSPGASRMSLTSAATGPRSSSGWARIAATTRVPPSSRGSWRESMGAALERQRERRDTAAVDRDRHLRRGHAGGGGDLLQQFPLQGVLREPVAVASRSRAPGRRRGSRRACPSSCARWVSGRPRFRARPPWRGRARAASGRRRAARAAPGARRMRSRSRRHRHPGATGRVAGPGSASPRSAGTSAAAGRRRSRRRGRRRRRRRARCGRPRRRSPRVTSTWIGPSIVSRLCACRSYRKWRPGCGSSTRTCRVPRSLAPARLTSRR